MSQTIRTTINPSVEIVVSDGEYRELLALGIVYGVGVPPPIGPGDAAVASLLGNVSSQTYATLLAQLAAAVSGETAPLSDALRAALVPTTPHGATAQPSMVTTSLSQSKLFAASVPPAFAPMQAYGANAISVDVNRKHQEILGYGAAVTDAAAYCLTKYLTKAQRTAILTEMFSPSQQNFSCVRICIGSSDYTYGGMSALYTYDDTPAAQSDGTLANFSIARDQAYIIPVLQEILAINPGIRIFASPWSPPARMKSGTTGGNGLIGGSFVSSYYQEYANYLVKFLQAYAAQGIPVFAITPQNEPLNTQTLYPGCQWTTAQLATFTGTYLAPALDNARLNTRIFAWDYSIDAADAIAILGDTNAGPQIDGVGWHGYNGADFVAMRQTQRVRPTSHIYFTEMCRPSTTTWAQNLAFFAGDQGVAIPRNGAETVIMWNLMLDQAFQPTVRTDTLFWPMLTVQNDGSGTITRNPDYYVLGHVSRYLQRGAVRVSSTSFGYGAASATLQSAAYLNPDGTRVLFLNNATATGQTVQVIDAESSKATYVTLQAGDVATLTWGLPALLAPTGTALALTAPGAPTGVAAVNSNGSIRLTWNAPTAGNTPTARYVIRRSTTSGQETLLATVAEPTRAWTDSSGLTAGTTYYYTVTAVNAAGEGTASGEVSAAPTVPGSLTLSATAGVSVVNLSWTAAANASGYTVKRGTTAGNETTTLATLGSGVTSYADTSGTVATTYYYTVTATNPVGSTVSNEVSAAPQTPPAPPAPTLSVTTGTAPQLSWTSSSGATSYQVLRGTSAGTETLLTTLGSGVTAFNDTSANGGVIYFYKVAAVNAGGSGISNEVSSASTRIAKPTTTLQPSLWLRADALTLANAAKVASWWDAGSGATPAVQATANNQPTFKTGVQNGYPAVSFDGTSAAMTAAQSLPAENVTVFFVGLKKAVTAQGMLAGGTASSKTTGGLNVYSANNGGALTVQQTPTTILTSSFGFGTSGTCHIGALSVDTAANSHAVTGGADGSVSTATPAAYTSSATATTNICGTVGVEFGAWDVCEIIVFQGCLSNADRHSWTAYLGTAYGITVGAS